MEFDFKVRHLNFRDRKRLLSKESVGVVKCKKDFPIYDINGKEELFKPLSKTKPWTTPFFAISEVFWSTVINQYFDDSAPIYKLAICHGYEEEFPSKYSKGVLVPSIISGDEELMNLLEYYRVHPCDSVDIDKYENISGVYYDYTSILKSPVFRDNKELGNALAYQILLSLLKNDLNFHYENVAFITRNGQITSLAPPIDHEFSLPFLFPEEAQEDVVKEQKDENEATKELPFFDILFGGYFNTLLMREAVPNTINLEAVINNINVIKEEYPDAVIKFVPRLAKFLEEFCKTRITLPGDFIEPCSSDMFYKYEEIFHEHKGIRYNKDVSKIVPVDINVDEFVLRLTSSIFFPAKELGKLLCIKKH